MKNIAIDGPAGAGKSTLAKEAAKALGYCYVDTGAIYRTIAYHYQMLGIGPRDRDNIHKLMGDAMIEIRYENGVQHMMLNGEDVTDALRTPELSKFASTVSANPEVRKFLLSMQREIAKRENCVMDGRDIGTVVLPKADLKLFVTASAEERARRRMLELEAKGEKAEFQKVLADINERDKADMSRSVAPLKQAADAILLDTTAMTPEACVAEVVRLARERGL